MTKDIQAIKVTIADQTETNQELDRKINEAISRLETLVKEFRASANHRQDKKTVPLRPRHSKSMPSMSGTMILMWLPLRLGALRF